MDRRITCLLLGMLLVGCEAANTAQRDAKREQDRAIMKLADAERDRDLYKAEVAKLKASLSEITAKEAEAASQLKLAKSENAALKSTNATMETLNNSLKAVSEQRDVLIKEMEEKMHRIEALTAELNRQATTRPLVELNK